MTSPHSKATNEAEASVPLKPGQHLSLAQRARRYRIQTLKDVQDHLLRLVPKALAVKEYILSDEDESIWLQDRVATDILDRVVPKPSQQVSIKGAIISAQYTDEELREVVAQRILAAVTGKEDAIQD